MYFRLAERGIELGMACHIDNRCNIAKILDIDINLANEALSLVWNFTLACNTNNVKIPRLRLTL